MPDPDKGHLTFTYRHGDVIKIGEDIEVRFNTKSREGLQVQKRIQIKAPKSIRILKIHREDLGESREADNKEG